MISSRCWKFITADSRVLSCCGSDQFHSKGMVPCVKSDFFTRCTGPMLRFVCRAIDWRPKCYDNSEPEYFGWHFLIWAKSGKTAYLVNIFIFKDKQMTSKPVHNRDISIPSIVTHRNAFRLCLFHTFSFHLDFVIVYTAHLHMQSKTIASNPVNSCRAIFQVLMEQVKPGL